MMSVAKVSIALVVVASLGLAVAAFDVIDTHQPGKSDKASLGQPNAERSDSEANLLAARYHMRGRTTRFFQRSTGSSRGSRYYRGIPATPATRPSGVHDKPTIAKKPDLAARYHLRTRTTRFFRRATA